MPRWLRIVRGMIGTGITFAVVIGALAAVVVTITGLVGGSLTLLSYGLAARFGVVGFIVGVLFSGALALAARSKSLRSLSLRLFTALGAGGGALYFGFLAANAFRVWTPRVALINFVTLTVMGAGAAAFTWLVARKAGAIGAGDAEDAGAIGEGAAEPLVRKANASERVG